MSKENVNKEFKEVEKENIVDGNKFIGRVLKQSDLYDIFPFQRTKMNQLIKSGQLPVVKVGKDYITTFHIIEKWLEDHIGDEIYY